MRYHKAHQGYGLLYKANGHLYKANGHLQVEAFTGVDWVESPSNIKSTTGYCGFLGANLITWKSKKQIVVARSSAEAEYRTMAHTSCKLMWIKHLLEE